MVNSRAVPFTYLQGGGTEWKSKINRKTGEIWYGSFLNSF